MYFDRCSTSCRGAEREKERIPKQPPCCQHRARRGPRTHETARSWPEPKSRVRPLTYGATWVPLYSSFLHHDFLNVANTFVRKIPSWNFTCATLDLEVNLELLYIFITLNLPCHCMLLHCTYSCIFFQILLFCYIILWPQICCFCFEKIFFLLQFLLAVTSCKNTIDICQTWRILFFF